MKHFYLTIFVFLLFSFYSIAQFLMLKSDNLLTDLRQVDWQYIAVASTENPSKEQILARNDWKSIKVGNCGIPEKSKSSKRIVYKNRK